MSRSLYDIWLEEKPPIPKLPYRAQMVNYVGSFKSQEAAEVYVTSIKKVREDKGLK